MVPTLQNMKHSHTRLCEGSGGRMLTNTEESKLTQQEVESFLKVTNASEDIKATKTEGSRANMGGEAGRKREEVGKGGA